MRKVELQGVANVRDLGGVPVSGGRVVRTGLMFRGSALSGATDDDLTVLSQRYGISHVIDLRVGWECEARPNRLVPGADQQRIPFFDKELVGVEYERPIPRTRMRGHDFVCDPDDFYRAMANPRTVGQMRTAVNAVLAYACAGEPVYFHCSGGKDRAGITALLVLTVLGAKRDAVVEDYLLTNVSRDHHDQEIFDRFLYLCHGDAQMARMVTDSHRARRENLASFSDEVRRRYGGIDAFVRDQLGIDGEQVRGLRAALTVEP